MMKNQLKSKVFHISTKHREYLISNLSLLLASAVPIDAALESLKASSKSRAFRRALSQIQSDINNGLPLWKALQRSGIVSRQTLTLIHLGEKSGNLTKNLQLAARQEEKQRVFAAKVRSALIYPIFVLSLTILVAAGVAWFLLPRLAVTFSQLNVELPLISRIFIKVGVFLGDYGAWVVPLSLLSIFILIYIIFALKQTRFIGQAILYKTPGISNLLYEVEIARLGYLMGTLLEAGLTITQTTNLMYGATQSARYKKLYKYLYRKFDEGYSFETNFKTNPRTAMLVPPAIQQMIIAGEKSGSLPDSLLTVGRIYEEKVEVSTRNLEVTLEPILLIIVWFGVLAVAVSVILPIYSLVGGL